MSTYRRTFNRDGQTQRTANHYVEFRDHAGKRRIVPAFRDRSASEELERKLERLVALRATGATPDAPMRRWIESLDAALRNRLADFGLLDAQQVAGLRPLSELLASWEQHLAASDASEHHVQVTAAAARRVFDGTGAKFWTDLDASAVENFLRDEREKPVKPIGARTSNSLLAAARQFCRWAVKTGRAVEDPLRSLSMLNVAEDRRRERRAATPEELRKLLDATARGPERNGMSGSERATLYRLAAETGLRKGEIVALVVADLDVADSERASVRVRAATAKNGREARLPLRSALADALAALVERRTPLARVFATPKGWEAAKTLEADLVAAGIAATDEAGRVLDFHALRTTFGTNLARSGVSLQMAQRLMRHSTPTLTANVYTVLSRDDERAAVAALPDSAPAVSAAVATGTDGASGVPLMGPLMGEAGTSSLRRGDGSGLSGARVTSRPVASKAAETLASEPAAGGGSPEFPVVGRVGFETTRNEPAEAPLMGPLMGASPEDARFEALRATWARLDDAARETVLRVAEGLARK